MPVIRGARCVGIPLNDFSRTSYLSKSSNVIPRTSMMNVGRMRAKNFCTSGCLDNTMPTWFKNSTNNIPLARVSTATRINNAIIAGMAQGTRLRRIPICIDRQYGRRCGTGGTGPANKF